MKKKFLILTIALMLALPQLCFASVGMQLDGAGIGQASVLNITGPDSVGKDGGHYTMPMVDPTLVAAGTGNGGATSMASATTAIPVTYGYVNLSIPPGSEFLAKTLADGKNGQILTLHVYNQPGSSTITITPATSTGFSAFTMNAIDDEVTLIFLNSTDGWIKAFSNSVTFVE